MAKDKNPGSSVPQKNYAAEIQWQAGEMRSQPQNVHSPFSG